MFAFDTLWNWMYYGIHLTLLQHYIYMCWVCFRVNQSQEHYQEKKTHQGWCHEPSMEHTMEQQNKWISAFFFWLTVTRKVIVSQITSHTFLPTNKGKKVKCVISTIALTSHQAVKYNQCHLLLLGIPSLCLTVNWISWINSVYFKTWYDNFFAENKWVSSWT